jgi:hypothetical protein
MDNDKLIAKLEELVKYFKSIPATNTEAFSKPVIVKELESEITALEAEVEQEKEESTQNNKSGFDGYSGSVMDYVIKAKHD